MSEDCSGVLLQYRRAFDSREVLDGVDRSIKRGVTEFDYYMLVGQAEYITPRYSKALLCISAGRPCLLRGQVSWSKARRNTDKPDQRDTFDTVAKIRSQTIT